MGRAVVGGLLGLVVGIAAGVAIGLGMAGDDAAQERVVIRRDVEPAAQAAPDAGNPAPTRRSRADDASTAAGAAEDAASADAAPAVAASPTGSGAIRVVVKSADGRPVPDIPFLLTAEFQPTKGSRTTNWTAAERLAQTSLDERMRLHLEREKWADATRQVRRSDTDGRLSFEGLGAGFHQVQAVVDDWRVMAIDPQLARRCKPGAELTFTATQLAGLRARVTLPDGTTPNSVMICFSVNDNSGHNGQGWTSPTTPLWQPPGRFRVWATGGGAAEWKSDPVTVDLVLGEVAEVDLPLRALPGFGGVVRVSADEWPGMAWAQMFAVRSTTADVPSMEQFQEGSQATTGPHQGWRYSFTGLSPGQYAVALVPSGSPDPIATWTVDVGASFVTRDFDLGPPERSSFLEVIVLDPEGTPCRPPVQFVLESRTASSERSSGALALTRPDGTFWLLLPSSAAQADATHAVIATHSEFGTKSAEFKPGPNAAVQIRFEWPAFAEITVEGWATHPDPGAFSFELRPVAAVRMQPGRYQYHAGTNGVPDATGKMRCGPVAPGEYEVSVRVKSGHGVRGIADTPVSLPVGTTAVRVSLPVLHALVIDGGAARAGKSYTIRQGSARQGGDHVGGYTADRNGAVTVMRLPAGEYTVHVAGEREAKTVTVPETSTLKL